jgi:nuclear GTP-binding protein
MEKDKDLVTDEPDFKEESKEPLFNKGQSKRLWNELYKVIDSSDVVVQVLDARDPQGTRSKHIENYLRQDKPHKHLIFILNKCDLIPTWLTTRWVAILSSEYPTLAFHASLTNSFGKGSLINLLRQFAKLHKDRKQISVGFIGYPNVGKSSIINTLRSKKVCNVAPIAGETKVWQYITLMKRIYLIDCPGVVYPVGDSDTDLVLKGVIRVENLKEPSEHISAVLERVKEDYVKRTYQVSSWSDEVDFLEQVARKSGKLLKGGEPDINTVSKMILNDFQRGKLPYFVKPYSDEKVDAGSIDDEECQLDTTEDVPLADESIEEMSEDENEEEGEGGDTNERTQLVMKPNESIIDEDHDGSNAAVIPPLVMIADKSQDKPVVTGNEYTTSHVVAAAVDQVEPVKAVICEELSSSQSTESFHNPGAAGDNLLNSYDLDDNLSNVTDNSIAPKLIMCGQYLNVHESEDKMEPNEKGDNDEEMGNDESVEDSELCEEDKKPFVNESVQSEMSQDESSSKKESSVGPPDVPIKTDDDATTMKKKNKKESQILLADERYVAVFELSEPESDEDDIKGSVRDIPQDDTKRNDKEIPCVASCRKSKKKSLMEKVKKKRKRLQRRVDSDDEEEIKKERNNKKRKEKVGTHYYGQVDVKNRRKNKKH